ncbi:hypothetical protein CHUAL_002386 [Chamberlinius hualienensis]
MASTSTTETDNSPSNAKVDSRNGEYSEFEGLTNNGTDHQEIPDETSPQSSNFDDEARDRLKNRIIIISLTVAFTINYIVPNVELVRKYSEAAENDRYVRMTLSYMIAPIFITSLINLAWYIDDDLRDKDEGLPRASRRTWWIRGIALVLQMGTVLRFCQSLIYGYKAKKSIDSVKEKYSNKSDAMERDGSLLKSFTSFMQGVPQYALQLYILLEGGTPSIEKEGALWQLLSMGGSFLGIVWATVSCDRILSATSATKVKTDWIAIALLLPWRLFSIGSRLTILALFSTMFPVYFGLGCVAHYLLMFALIQRQKVTQHNERRGEVFLFLVGGLVFIVTDIMVKYERSYHKYILYYSIALVEGTAMMIVWYIYANNVEPMTKLLLPVGVGVSFFLGLLFLRIYYEYSHPKTPNILHVRSCCQQPIESA